MVVSMTVLVLVLVLVGLITIDFGNDSQVSEVKPNCYVQQYRIISHVQQYNQPCKRSSDGSFLFSFLFSSPLSLLFSHTPPAVCVHNMDVAACCVSLSFFVIFM